MSGPRASVVIPAWNAGDVLGACLDTLLGQELDGGFETIVVNDGSPDDTAAVLESYGDRIRVETHAENRGFSAACNTGAAAARGRVLFFLNSDTELVEPGTLERVIAAAEEPGTGIVGPMLVNPDGSVQSTCVGHSGVRNALLITTGAWRLMPAASRRRLVPQFWSHDAPADVDCVLGAAVAIRRELFESLGGFWDVVFQEEQDLAYRVQRLGYRVRFDPSARIVHIGNHSFAKRWSDPARAEVVARAELAFVYRHYPAWRAGAVRAILWAGWAARALALRLLRRPQRAGVYASLARTYLTR